MSTTPNLDLPQMPQNSLQPSVPYNEAMQLLDAIAVLVLEDLSLNDPPATVAADAGKRWIVGATPTGDWVGHTNDIALCTGAGLWAYITPKAQWRGWVLADGGVAANTYYRFNGAAWVDDSAAGGVTEAPEDDHFYARKNGAWAQRDPQDLSGYVQKVNGVAPDGAGNVNTPSPYRLAGVNDQTGTAYTLALSDAGKDVRCTNAAAVVLTVPAAAGVAFPVGTLIAFSQGGAGAVTATSDGTTVIRAANGAATSAQYDARALEYLGSDEWRVW